jgi:outer membrane protein assembly factor BamA
VFSDYLGNHQIYVATDLVNTIDQSIIQAFYLNNKNRVNFGGGFFHSKNFYLDNDNHLFSDRFYGVQLFARRPFSTFSRLEASVSQFFVDRKFYDFDDPRPNSSLRLTTGVLSWVTDNVLWGYTGPINGRRARVTLEGAKNFFDNDDIEYAALGFDYRRYWHFRNTFSIAFRLSAGASEGSPPKRYYLGGTTNWIGSRTVADEVYDTQNLYFSDIVTPLRGVPYYELSGNRYGLINWEFRFPMVQYFIMRFPLKLAITNITGVVFTDVGAAWDNDNFKGGTTADGRDRLQDIKTGFGFGMRANLLGFILLRYDLAWSTDFADVSHRPTHYFSFGADF